MTALVRYEQDPALRDSNDRQQARRDREQAQLQAELAQIDMIRKAASERKVCIAAINLDCAADFSSLAIASERSCIGC